MRSVSVVIPNYNGRGLLERNLPTLWAATAHYGGAVEIIVVDDASRDDSVTFLAGRYPGIRLLCNDRNVGFSGTMNRGIEHATGEIILSLNNDIAVDETLFTACVPHLDDPRVFSITPNMIDPRTGVCQSIPRFVPGYCWFGTRYLQPSDIDGHGLVPVFYGSGGCSFYDAAKLKRLGGFDPLYHPYYIEDIDLSYRAWKAGWVCLMTRETTVYHETSSTIRPLVGRRKIKFVGDRNRTLFLWANITDPPLVARYLCLLPFSLLYDLVAFRKYKFIGFFRALAHLTKVRAARKARRVTARLTDREVFSLIT